MVSQKTVLSNASLNGIGLHSGEEVGIVLEPAEANTGIIFIRDGQQLTASIENVYSSNRSTTLKKFGFSVGTVEHLMAALYGMQIDNVIIRLIGEELPAADGSSLPYVEIIRQAGLKELSEKREVAYLSEPIWISRRDSHFIALPSNKLRITCSVEFNHPIIGNQIISIELDENKFVKELAPARTFGFSHEIEYLRGNGLALGGSEDNAIIVYDDHYSTTLRYKDEIARHKALDILGDISLVGVPLAAHLIAIKPSHQLNIEMVKKLHEAIH